MSQSIPGPDAKPLLDPPSRSGRRAEDFFVAGGPVAPDRACYIERSTDAALNEVLQAGEYCHVIAPRFSGKTSLAARAASRLRAEGALAAVVDLSQLGGREGAAEVGRWYYGFAYRVLRDLRLKFDLQQWWQERMPLPPAQRLGEFFWEVVVASSRARVYVFLDEIESVEQSDHAAELFRIVRDCHDARASEPEYRRLSFVLLGAALPGGSAERAGIAATEIGMRLDLPDFSFSEARPLAAGLGMPAGDAERALYRILYWTSGHPYLTQKLCQAVARNCARIDSDEAVDRLVAARFLARNVATSEASMSQVIDILDRAGKLARPSMRLYRRIRRGRKPRYEQDNPEHRLLRISGLVAIGSDQCLKVRNKIYSEVFSHRWARQALPFEWVRLGRVAALSAVVAGLVWFYLGVLPRPYEETLKVVSVELDEAHAAWEALRRIPGFAPRADRLMGRVLVRRSRLAESWTEAQDMDARLRTLSGFEARADGLLVEYWERRAAAAEAAEQRDAALLYRLRAFEAGPTADGGLAAELVGSDYRLLRTVVRPAGLVEAIAPAADGRSVVTLSGGNLVERWDMATGNAAAGPRLELLAEEFVTVRRRLSLDTPGRVASMAAEVLLDHARPQDLHLRLISPSGRVAVLDAATGGARGDAILFDESTAPGIRAMRGEQAQGTWLLEVEDRGQGELGFLAGWRLAVSSAAGHRAEDRPENPLLIPAPTLSSAVRAALSPHGNTVAALPRNPEARGRLATWHAASGQPLAAIDVGAGDRWIGFADEDTLLLLQGEAPGQLLRVLDAPSGRERFSRLAPSGFAAGPALSPDAMYLALAEAAPNLAWIRELASGREVFRLLYPGEATAVAVAPGGLMLALADRGGVLRVWHATDGRLLGEYFHDGAAFAAISFDPVGRWLAAADTGGRVFVWDLSSPGSGPVLTRGLADPGGFAFDPSGGRFGLLGQEGGYEVWQLPDAVPYGPILRHDDTRAVPAGLADRLAGQQRMLLGQGQLVGGVGTRSVRIWQTEHDLTPAELPRVPATVALASSGLRTAVGMSDGRVALRIRDPDSLALRLENITSGEMRHGGGISALAFSPEGGRLVSVGTDGSVALWESATGQSAAEMFQHGSGRVASVALGPEGRVLVTAGELGARSWDSVSGVAGTSLGPGRHVSAVALDRTAARAYTGTPAGEIEGWSTTTGERLWSAPHGAPVTVIALSRDGNRVAAGSDTGSVQVWGVGSAGRPLGVTLAAPVVALQFAPDGMTLLAQTASWMHRLAVVDGRLRVLASRLLPAAVAPGAWRIATHDGRRVVLVVGAHGESMQLLDFERAPLPAEDWEPELEAWQQTLKLYFDPEGELRDGLYELPLPVVFGTEDEAPE
jgi:WD40 repeat protein